MQIWVQDWQVFYYNPLRDRNRFSYWHTKRVFYAGNGASPFLPGPFSGGPEWLSLGTWLYRLLTCESLYLVIIPDNWDIFPLSLLLWLHVWHYFCLFYSSFYCVLSWKGILVYLTQRNVRLKISGGVCVCVRMCVCVFVEKLSDLKWYRPDF